MCNCEKRIEVLENIIVSLMNKVTQAYPDSTDHFLIEGCEVTQPITMGDCGPITISGCHFEGNGSAPMIHMTSKP